MSSNDQTIEETQLGVALDADPGFQQEQQEQEQNINNNYYEAAAVVTNENKWNRNGFGGTYGKSELNESNFCCLESNQIELFTSVV